MKKTTILFLTMFILSGCASKTSPTAVLCGTTMAESLVRDVAGGSLVISTLIPPDACPGHFDMKPSDAQKALSASVFICQPFQAPLAEKLAQANPRLRVLVIKTRDINVPDNYFSALNETASLLSDVHPAQSGEFAAAVAGKIRAISARLAEQAGWMEDMRAKKPAAVCSAVQAAFASYLGFNVCAVFGESETTTPVMVEDSRLRARRAKAALIISNLTGTHDATADAINRGLGLKKAVLMSFPGSSTDGSMYLTLWEYNIARIKEAYGGER